MNGQSNFHQGASSLSGLRSKGKTIAVRGRKAKIQFALHRNSLKAKIMGEHLDTYANQGMAQHKHRRSYN